MVEGNNGRINRIPRICEIRGIVIIGDICDIGGIINICDIGGIPPTF
jgi:hypothetical protein